MTPEEQYDKALAELDVKPGDIVEVVRKVDDYDEGWDNIWPSESETEYIGERFTVEQCRCGILLNSAAYFPPQALKKVEK